MKPKTALKTLLLPLALLLPTAATATEHAEVRVATRLGPCNEDLGYVIETGSNAKAVYRAADAKIRARFPEARAFHQADSNTRRGGVQTHLYVVSSRVKHQGCISRAFGVGFGQDEASALKD
ncbi:MAG TPA: hypothetical protein VFO83_16225, partial [Aggregicoccus sp.]|nr:hypothetical protein [Aggregicoccus sp.]